MKTLAKIEKLAEKLAAEEANRHDYPYDLDARELESIYLKGFIDCMKFMLEREKVAKDALNFICGSKCDAYYNPCEARETLEKLK